MAWESIVEEWHGNVTTEAITETVQLANRAFFDHLDKYVLESWKESECQQLSGVMPWLYGSGNGAWDAPYPKW